MKAVEETHSAMGQAPRIAKLSRKVQRAETIGTANWKTEDQRVELSDSKQQITESQAALAEYQERVEKIDEQLSDIRRKKPGEAGG